MIDEKKAALWSDRMMNMADRARRDGLLPLGLLFVALARLISIRENKRVNDATEAVRSLAKKEGE